ncbi:conserved hypothetical protein [Hyella patelloides LEGE 07179]|uniref:Uncharacterized protein n=1 Tax=Hyella patelloides LEGE 07179 TaxID=945734 RepID=A0A563VNA7_9CYAN|nr:hypothetical protein [Hyella patelloides]VEP12940.1 conserved hypothetical protein [Hyella patelloides LEGE 07179]
MKLFLSAVVALKTVIAIKVVASSDVGLHIEFSEIKNTFHRTLTRYTGECPGKYWSGIAQNGDLRFIDYNIEPSNELKVNLINLVTGEKITRDYKKARLGSNDFNLTQLGNLDGEHNIEYEIYHKDTKKTVATGNFIYTVTSSEETKQRDAQWKPRLYCASDSDRKLQDCDTVASRKIKYCDGRETGDSQHQGTFDLDRKTVEIDL